MFTVNFHMQLLQYRLKNKIRHFWRLNYAWYSNNHTLNIQLRFSRKLLLWIWSQIILSPRYRDIGRW